jgi:hypothetical protein
MTMAAGRHGARGWRPRGTAWERHLRGEPERQRVRDDHQEDRYQAVDDIAEDEHVAAGEGGEDAAAGDHAGRQREIDNDRDGAGGAGAAAGEPAGRRARPCRLAGPRGGLTGPAGWVPDGMESEEHDQGDGDDPDGVPELLKVADGVRQRRPWRAGDPCPALGHAEHQAHEQPDAVPPPLSPADAAETSPQPCAGRSTPSPVEGPACPATAAAARDPAAGLVIDCVVMTVPPGRPPLGRDFWIRVVTGEVPGLVSEGCP